MLEKKNGYSDFIESQSGVHVKGNMRQIEDIIFWSPV